MRGPISKRQLRPMLIEQIAEALSVELEKVTVGRRLAGLSNQVERHAGQVHSVLVPVLGSLRRQRPRNCGVLALPSISSSKGSHSARLAAFTLWPVCRGSDSASPALRPC